MTFSTNELLYILGTLGLSYNMMLGDPFRGVSKEVLKEEFEKGKKILEDKHLLIKRTAREFELDLRIKAMLDMVTEAHYSFSITLLKKPGDISQFQYFFQHGQSLMMTLEGRFYHFFVYQNEKSLINYLQPMLGVYHQISQGVPKLTLPQQNFAGTLLSIWRNPDEALSMLANNGLDEKQAQTSVEIISNIDVASILLLQPRVLTTVPRRMSYLLSSLKGLWWSEPDPAASGQLIFTPLPFSHTAITKAPDYFDDVITFDLNSPNISARLMEFVRGGESPSQKSSKDEEVFL